MTGLALRPEGAQAQERRPSGNCVSWTDILRRRQYRETLMALQQRLATARSVEEQEHIIDAIQLIESEISQWAII